MKMSLSKTLLSFMLVSVIIFVGTVLIVYNLYSRNVQVQECAFLSQLLDETAGRITAVC